MTDRNDSSRTQRVFFRARDFLWLVVLLAVALLFYFASKGTPSNAPLVAVVSIEGEVVDRIVLEAGVEKDFHYEQSPGVYLHQYADQTIAVIASDCPDKICVRTGRIGEPGAFVACVPNRLIVTLTEQEGTDSTRGVDVIA